MSSSSNAGYRCRCCRGLRCETVFDGVRDWEYGVEGSWTHLRCLDCGVVQLDPFPTLELLASAYDLDYHGYAVTANKGAIYSLLYKINDAVTRRRLRRLLPAAGRVLDVGCGMGEFLATLGRLGFGPLMGIDFSQRAVAGVRAKGIAAYQGLFLDFPSEDFAFDLVVMNNYLEHTIDPGAELRKARRLLRPGGVLFGEIPNYRAVDRFVFGRYWGGVHAPRHTFHFSPRTLSALLSRHGFGEIRISHQVNTGHMALSVQNLMQRGRADLRANPSIKHGRAAYYPLLLLGMVPLNALCAALGLSGIMKFSARAKG